MYFKEIQNFLQMFAEIHPTEYSADEAKVRDINSITIIPDDVYNANQQLFENGVEFLKKPDMSREVSNLI